MGERKSIKRIKKAQLVDEASGQIPMSASDIDLAVSTFLHQMELHLSQGESISLSSDGLGRFDIVKWAPRYGHNVFTGQKILIPSKWRIKYVPSQNLKSIRKKD